MEEERTGATDDARIWSRATNAQVAWLHVPSGSLSGPLAVSATPQLLEPPADWPENQVMLVLVPQSDKAGRALWWSHTELCVDTQAHRTLRDDVVVFADSNGEHQMATDSAYRAWRLLQAYQRVSAETSSEAAYGPSSGDGQDNDNDDDDDVVRAVLAARPAAYGQHNETAGFPQGEIIAGHDRWPTAEPAATDTPSEKVLLEARLARVALSQRRLFAPEEEEERQSPGLRIGVACSGGGIRAMLGTIGLLDGLKDAKLLDCVSYVAGVSGSTWALASWYASRSSPFHFASPDADENTDPLRMDETLSADHRTHPGTLAMATKGMPFQEWVKEWVKRKADMLLERIWQRVAARQPVNFVDVWAAFLGSKLLGPEYKQGANSLLFAPDERKIADMRAGLYPVPVMAAVTSNLARDLEAHRERPRRWLWLDFTFSDIGSRPLASWVRARGFGQRVDPHSGCARSGPESEAWMSTMMGLWGSAMSFDGTNALEALLGTGVLGRLMRKLIPDKLRSWSIPGCVAHVSSFFCGGNGAPSTIDIRDAGVDINIPFPTFSHESDRHVDALIVLDCSGGAKGVEELIKAIESGYIDVDINEARATVLKQGEMAVFRPTRDHTHPLVLYIQGPTTPSTLHFMYSHAEAQDAMEVARAAVEQNSESVVSELKALWNTKRGL